MIARAASGLVHFEIGSRAAVFERPMHPYTRKLLSAVPVADPTRRPDRPMLDGEIPSPVRRVGDAPRILSLKSVAPDHKVAETA